jgi:hypothetical protein
MFRSVACTSVQSGWDPCVHAVLYIGGSWILERIVSHDQKFPLPTTIIIILLCIYVKNVLIIF